MLFVLLHPKQSKSYVMLCCVVLCCVILSYLISYPDRQTNKPSNEYTCHNANFGNNEQTSKEKCMHACIHANITYVLVV